MQAVPAWMKLLKQVSGNPDQKTGAEDGDAKACDPSLPCDTDKVQHDRTDHAAAKPENQVADDTSVRTHLRVEVNGGLRKRYFLLPPYGIESKISESMVGYRKGFIYE